MEKSKRVRKNKISYSTGSQAEVKNFIIVIIVVLLCVVGIYFLTRVFVTKDLFTHEEKTEETVPGVVDYDLAIVGEIMNRPYDEYYVAIYDMSGSKTYDMSTLVSNYKAKNKLHIYKVDLSNHLNKYYYKPEEVNEKATSVEDLKVGDTTLLKIKRTKNKDGEYTYKITKYITDLAQMKKELGIE